MNLIDALNEAARGMQELLDAYEKTMLEADNDGDLGTFEYYKRLRDDLLNVYMDIDNERNKLSC